MVETKIKYLIFGLKTKISPKIVIAFEIFFPGSGSGLGKTNPDPQHWSEVPGPGSYQMWIKVKMLDPDPQHYKENGERKKRKKRGPENVINAAE